MTPDQPLTPGEILTKNILEALKNLPPYVIHWVLGFYVIFVEAEVTAMAIIAVIVGIETNDPLWGVVTFLGLWLLARILGAPIAIAQSVRSLSNAITVAATTLRSGQNG